MPKTFNNHIASAAGVQTSDLPIDVDIIFHIIR
jgi:hypothetical protein